MATNSYGRDLTREEIEVWRSLYYKAEDALTPKGIEQLPILCDMALRTLDQSNGPSSELLDLRARIDAIGIEVLGGKYLYRVDEIKRFDATGERS